MCCNSNSDIRFSEHFLFTQHSLSTFESCPLKFKKRYMENLRWDRMPDENVKRGLERGNNFHLMAFRYFSGIEPGTSEFSEEFSELNEWFISLNESFEIKPELKYYPEYKIRMSSGNLKLEANYDLIISSDDGLQIWDWKTHGQKASSKKNFSESLQTYVYMFVLKEQSHLIWGQNCEAGRITMTYWQPESPNIMAVIRYSDYMHERFKSIISGKIETIQNYDYSTFDKELYKNSCKNCEFNWYCNNERVDFRAMEEDMDFLDDLLWDDIEARY